MYGAELFEGAVQLKLFSETLKDKYLQIVPHCGTIQGCSNTFFGPFLLHLIC